MGRGLGARLVGRFVGRVVGLAGAALRVRLRYLVAVAGALAVACAGLALRVASAMMAEGEPGWVQAAARPLVFGVGVVLCLLVGALAAELVRVDRREW